MPAKAPLKNSIIISTVLTEPAIEYTDNAVANNDKTIPSKFNFLFIETHAMICLTELLIHNIIYFLFSLLY